MEDAVVLYIDRFDSHCGVCGRSCAADSETHDTILGYIDNGKQGCGAKFTHVSSNYPNLWKLVAEMRPDLIPVSYDEDLTI